LRWLLAATLLGMPLALHASGGACPVPPPANGTMGTCPGTLSSGSTCQFSCNAGYTLTGSTTSCLNGVLTAQTCLPTTGTIVAGDLLLIVYDTGDQWTYILDLGVTGQALALMSSSPSFALNLDPNWQEFTNESPAREFVWEVYGGTGNSPRTAISYASPVDLQSYPPSSSANFMAVQRYDSLVSAANGLSPSLLNSVINTSGSGSADFNQFGLMSLLYPNGNPNQFGTSSNWALYVYSNLSSTTATFYGGTFSLSYSGFSYVPPVITLNTTAMISSGNGSSTCALSKAGAVQCWGLNQYGELGNGTFTNSSTPVPVTGLQSGVAQIGVGQYSACALTSAGAVQCWGYGGYGQLGSGTTTNASTPVPVAGLNGGVTAIGVGELVACALTSAGAVQCWGNNQYGGLGNGTLTNSSAPVPVTGLQNGVTAISVGFPSACALSSAGAVQCWGDNQYGELGNGTFTSSSTPVPVTGLQSGVTAISVGAYFACAITSAGAVQCWGDNLAGELGNGSANSSSTPVPVTGLNSGVTAISVGSGFACALTNAGAVECWGINEAGELGNGTLTNSSTPAPVTGLQSGMIAIAAGYDSACALASTGAVQCWGVNTGNYSLPSSRTAVTVTGLNLLNPSGAGGGADSSNTVDGPIPMWALAALGAGLFGLGSRRSARAPKSASR
jgi:alpha-tubulin suppressor-like RCC1 family protein